MGGMITYHDYECAQGTVTEYGNNPNRIFKSIKCPCCGKRARMTWAGGFNNMARWNFNSRERGVGLDQPDPQTGVTYTSTFHRDQVYKEQGLEYAHDTVKGARTDYGVDPDPVPRDPNVLEADSLDDIGKLIDQDKIDREHTGGNDPTKFCDDEDSPGF
jgi:hypothetical protein